MTLAIILSGGTGLRLGTSTPKQYIEVNKRPIIADCINTLANHSLVDKYIIVAAKEWEEYILKVITDSEQTTEDSSENSLMSEKFLGFAAPGENRQLSIYSGLKAIGEIAQDGDVVIIHDAARPFVTENTITELIRACDNADGAMPALPVKDTMYIQENGRVKALIDRDSLIAGQAPEAFKYKKYLAANEALLPDGILSIKGSTEPAFKAGMNIAVISGDENNFKITTRDDLDRYIEKMQNHQSDS